MEGSGLRKGAKITVGTSMRNKRNKSITPAELKSKMLPRELRPNRSALKIGGDGIVHLAPDLVVPESVGWKAYGLSTLPTEWVPTYFVIGALGIELSDPELHTCVGDALGRTSISSERIMVRSSGTEETMRDRGQLTSEVCPKNKIVSTVRRLSRALIGELNGKVHWIVQPYLPPAMKGHLSNERHLSYEHRDWIAEIEGQAERQGYTSKIAIRRWRDGVDLPDLDLSCVSEAQVTLRLRKVAKWATAFGCRVHFEWVWDGKTIWIVQADHAEDESGIDPTALSPDDIPEVSPAALSAFIVADDHHFDNIRKLRNAKQYSELGYQMPQFYVLQDAAILKSLLQGEMPAALQQDLRELTKRPLVIRTDVNGFTNDKPEMLPRSDELRSADEANAWLLNEFRQDIEKSNLQSTSLCLVAHHFIPSIASAWARAEPGRRLVRIESLWGLPEGLYWYSHDTFEVDTQPGVPYTPTGPRYSLRERRRYKGTFVGPDKDGRWIPCHTAVPYDWHRSIKRRKWIFEIASTTRILADLEGHPITLMWFIDNDKRATKHSVLPWYHERSLLEDQPKAAPRKKFAISQDHTIEKRKDWEKFKQYVRGGTRFERIVVKPTDPSLIRNREFVNELARFASDYSIVVELAGGVLSHAYYALKRAGAQVECVDLFGADEDIVEYNKVVRDKIPEVIEGRGERVDVVQLRGDALLLGLRQKLVEEAYETLDAKTGEEIVVELADVEEVLTAIAGALRTGKRRIERECSEKRKRRGGFEGGYMLRKTATPHSLSAPATPSKDHELSLAPKLELHQVIADPLEIPIAEPYRRPDLRSVGQEIEKLFTFETELNKAGTAKETVSFDLPLGSDATRAFALSIEFTRKGAVIRGNVRLRVQPKQMRLMASDKQLTLGLGEEK